MAFPGTISLRSSTLEAIINDFVISLISHGFTRIVMIPSHGGNFAPLKNITEVLQREHPDTDIISTTDLTAFIEMLNAISAEFGVTKEEAGAQAGETEASVMLALAENLVNIEHFAAGYTGPLGVKETELLFEKGMTALSENGVLGDPRKASAEKGAVYLDRIVDYLVEEIEPNYSK